MRIDQNDEKNSDSDDLILQKIYFTYEKHKVPLFSNLFRVWIGGCAEVWCCKGRTTRCLENLEVQSFFKRRI